jgi:DNA-binding response OmpR family regulator
VKQDQKAAFGAHTLERNHLECDLAQLINVQPFAQHLGRALSRLLDDELDTLEALQLFLRSERFEVITCSSGGEARLVIREWSPNLIITDETMPGITGLQLCGFLRAYRKTNPIPIVLYTALSVPAESWLYDLTVKKPANLSAFAKAIRGTLGRTPLMADPLRRVSITRAVVPRSGQTSTI